MSFRDVMLVFCLFWFSGWSQEKDAVLVTVGDIAIYTDEFMRAYSKNRDLLSDSLNQDIETYLHTFINFKLKVLEAKRLGMHKRRSYLEELSLYREQFAERYLTDQQMDIGLIKEAYERLKTEVNVDHILVPVNNEASPSDTLKAWKAIHDIRQKVSAETFSSVMNTIHNDKNIYGESLGFFTVCKMTYPFENVAYNTPEGAVSKPFRTAFGYHILKVNKIRNNRGAVKVAHITLYFQPHAHNALLQNRINIIYKRLLKGEDFAVLAKQFSDDKASADKGGAIPCFRSGDLGFMQFEEMAFATDAGQISLPFKTRLGWHIIKVDKKFPIGTFEEERPYIEKKLSKDQRTRKVTPAFIDSLKVMYAYKVHVANRQELFSLLNRPASIAEALDTVLMNKELFRLRNTVFKSADFLKYLQAKAKPRERTYIYSELPVIFEEMVTLELLALHKKLLEKTNEEFASILEEYRDGLLVYDLTQEKIWAPSLEDTVALRKHYMNNLNKYSTEEQVEVLIASASSSLHKELLKKIITEDTEVPVLQKKADAYPELATTLFLRKILPLNSVQQMDNFDQKTILFEEDTALGYRLTRILRSITSKNRSFEEVRGVVLNDYQQVLEEKWINRLRQNHTIDINKEQLRKIKKSISVE
ncbi:peptidylprolyl isomerase [Ascidiimonas aurantiaca]|uniref:peptidylprolyl isomerase n=1 Tax=Ascidiimonas aurantiaca TaxID=1685432 RepID=UPI0030EE504A